MDENKNVIIIPERIVHSILLIMFTKKESDENY